MLGMMNQESEGRHARADRHASTEVRASELRVFRSRRHEALQRLLQESPRDRVALQLHASGLSLAGRAARALDCGTRAGHRPGSVRPRQGLRATTSR